MQLQDIQSAAVDLVVCPRCEARPESRCKTISGKTTETHVPRWEPLYDAWLKGYAEGHAEARAEL